jgi:hypothetical protein
MTIDIAQAVSILKTALLAQMGDKVDLIFRYGSRLRGNPHRYSDLDLSWVPAQESTWHSITVMVGTTMIDLYPMHWSKLERMGNFDDASATVLLESEIIYQRTEAAAERFRQLGTRLREMQQPAAYPTMLARAHAIFERTGYPYYLLREQAGRGHRLSCMQHSRQILRAVCHCLAACNQSPADTRKLDQVLALPKLPTDFAATVERLTHSTDPAELLSACETLMRSTRELLLAEQKKLATNQAAFPEVFESGYPEFKNDVQHLMLACERRDMFNFNFISLYHELMIHMAQATSGVEYSGFNTVEDYEQDLTALGFPDLLAYLVAGDLDGLRQQCPAFDERLRQYLTERGVALCAFETLDDLETHLKATVS